MIYGGLVVAVVACAFMAMRAKRLLSSALWLAACSAFVSILFYLMGAAELAVIELSVGAGLVTVLFVLTISVAGDDPIELKSIIRKPIAWTLVLAPIGLLAYTIIPSLTSASATGEPAFAEVMWQQRGLDALAQSGLIFAAVVGMLGLLSDAKARLTPSPSPDDDTAVVRRGEMAAPPLLKSKTDFRRGGRGVRP